MSTHLQSQSRREEISARARLLWHIAGEPRGRDAEFWFAAQTRVERERLEIERAVHELRDVDTQEAA